MADDAPANAGTDNSTGQAAHPQGGETALTPSPSDGPAVVHANGTTETAASRAQATGGDGADIATEPEPGDPPTAGMVPATVAAADGSAVTDRVDIGTPANTDADGGPTAAAGGKGRSKGSFWRELPVLVVIAVALAVLIRTFLVQAFFIPSGSMEKTLHGCPGCSGDKVLVNKLVYRFHDPRPGDIVVFRGPPSWESEVQLEQPGNPVSRALRWIGQTIGIAQPDEKDFVKRVIAVGGQTVACCDAEGRVTVDGKPLDEPYVYRSFPEITPQEFGPVTVPEGRLWVMGDHRDESADSRAHIDDGSNGTIAVDDVIGKAFVIVWPPSRWATLGTPPTFRSQAAGPLLEGVPIGMGLVGALPLVGLRRRRRARRCAVSRPTGRPRRGWWRHRRG